MNEPSAARLRQMLALIGVTTTKHDREVTLSYDQIRSLLNATPARAIPALPAEQVGVDTKWLGELLAVVHKDGGHHHAAVGTEHAVLDAMTEYHRLRAIEDAALATPAPQQPVSAEALTRMLPIFERLLKDVVFTADKAGQVAADMAALRTTLTPPQAEPGKDSAEAIPAQEQADAARLDHLQKRGATVEILPDGSEWKFRIGGLHAAVHRDIRAAIDAARNAQGESNG